jgi:hypothetical protein
MLLMGTNTNYSARFNSGDVNEDNSVFLYCGSSKYFGVNNTLIYSALVISFDINWQMNFHYGIEEGTIDSSAYCRFAEAGTFIAEVTSSSISINYKNSFSLYKFTESQGKLI